ncbi:O-antigen ligase family protein [Williamsia muralis]|uniref:O-antigen ligase family protein n=1 Tax=Williamsia marianensis TaxID=85044 RepID=A0ABU4EP63_WILMA|nr:O-antigen ligase family protein [Williamsia muralis]MDV7132546.1 O-antigen ligase family protein [Williamsia muralis]
MVTTTRARNNRRQPQSKRRYGPTSVNEWIWIVIALGVPVYRSLPDSIAQLWTLGTLGVILLSAVFLNLARPIYPRVWFLCGSCVVAATFTAVNDLGGFTDNLYVGVQLSLLLGVAPFVLARAVKTPGFIPRVCYAFMIAQTVSAAAAILQVSGRSVFGQAVVNDRAPGLAGHPNVLGVMSSIALVLLLHAALTRSRRKLMLVVLLLINLGGLLATGSLSSMLAAAVGLTVAALAMRVRVKQVAWTVAAALSAFFVAVNFTGFGERLQNPTERLLQVTGQTEAVSTLDIRGETYSFAWDWISQNPFLGVGLAAHQAVSFDNATVVHNVFLRSWYQGGFLLALAIGVIIIAAIVLAFRSVTFGRDGAAAGILVAVMVFACTSAFFEQAYYWLPALLAFAAIGQSRALNPLRSSS